MVRGEAVGIFDHARARWRRFMGKTDDLGLDEAKQASDSAELEFRKALFKSSGRRASFDTRPPPSRSDPPAALTPEDLRENLDEVDRQVREALDDEEQ